MGWLIFWMGIAYLTDYSQSSSYLGPIVHLFEWKFDDIASECESFLSLYGYGGVQVSPIAECVMVQNRPWYERYQPISYNICSRSGDETSFKNMVRRCNKVGVKIYVDVVLNHMTGNHETARGVCGSTANTKEFKYPAVSYDKEDFNLPTCGIQNYDNYTEMAVGFMLAWPHGLPRVMSSYDFTDGNAGPPHNGNYSINPVIVKDNLCSGGWICEHRWRQIYNMAKFRKIVHDTAVSNWWDNGNNQIAFCRGNKGFIAFNIDGYDLNTRLQTCLPEGKYCDIISGDLINGKCTGKEIQVDQGGRANIIINTSEQDGFVAIHSESKI